MTQLADISPSEVKKVNNLEKDLGVVLIAYKPLEFADLSPSQIKELQKVEKDLGAKVVAYR